MIGISRVIEYCFQGVKFTALVVCNDDVSGELMDCICDDMIDALEDEIEKGN